MYQAVLSWKKSVCERDKIKNIEDTSTTWRSIEWFIWWTLYDMTLGRYGNKRICWVYGHADNSNSTIHIQNISSTLRTNVPVSLGTFKKNWETPHKKEA